MFTETSNNTHIVTRPLAAAIIQENKNEKIVRANSARNRFRETSDLSQTSSMLPETFKVVFDMTESKCFVKKTGMVIFHPYFNLDTMDASVIRIKNSKDFQVLCNVGDTNIGVNDIDEKIVGHIFKEKSKRNKNPTSKSDSLETINGYVRLCKSIKEQIIKDGCVTVDLQRDSEELLQETDDDDSVDIDEENEEELDDNTLYLDKNFISKVLCKDIYDWSLAHIERAIYQSDISENDIHEILLIGGNEKMPGFVLNIVILRLPMKFFVFSFREYLNEAYPNKTITNIKDDTLAVGAALMVIYLLLLTLYNFLLRNIFV
jgi:hypothetical protein